MLPLLPLCLLLPRSLCPSFFLSRLLRMFLLCLLLHLWSILHLDPSLPLLLCSLLICLSSLLPSLPPIPHFHLSIHLFNFLIVVGILQRLRLGRSSPTPLLLPIWLLRYLLTLTPYVIAPLYFLLTDMLLLAPVFQMSLSQVPTGRRFGHLSGEPPWQRSSTLCLGLIREIWCPFFHMLFPSPVAGFTR